MKNKATDIFSVRTLGMINNINLCGSCRKEVATCDGDNIIFGTGKGDDNIAACSMYTPLARHKWSLPTSSSSPQKT